MSNDQRTNQGTFMAMISYILLHIEISYNQIFTLVSWQGINLEISNDQFRWLLFNHPSPPVFRPIKWPKIQLPASSCISRYHMMKRRGKESTAFLIQNFQMSNDQPSNVISLQWFSHPYPPVSRYVKWPKIFLPTSFYISSYHLTISPVFPYQGINCPTTFCISICQMTNIQCCFLAKF